MTMRQPPRFAVWMLEHVDLADEALVGDLTEAYDAGRSDAWFWRQTALAILVGLGREIGTHKLAALGTVFASVVVLSLATRAGAELTMFAGRWTWTGGAEDWRDLSAGLLYRVPFLLAMCVGGVCGGWIIAHFGGAHRPRMVVVFALFPLCSSLLYILRTLKAAASLGLLPTLNSLFAAAVFMGMGVSALAGGFWAARPRQSQGDSRS